MGKIRKAYRHIKLCRRLLLTKSKMVPKFCANLSFMFTESSSLLERYQLASELGFHAVECAFPYEYSLNDVVQAKTKANVDQILINTYPGDEGQLGFAATPGKESAFRDSLDKTISYATALGCNMIHIMAGKILPGIVDAGMADVYEDNLRYAANLLESKGMMGVIEPISRDAVPNYYMNSYENALKIVKKLNSKSLKLQLDVFHLQLLKGNLTRNITELLPYTGHIQISQVPGRNEPNTDGEINYQYILQLLEEKKYDGYIGLEYKPKTSTKSSTEWISNWGYSF